MSQIDFQRKKRQSMHQAELEEIQSQSGLVLVTVFDDGVWWRYENGMQGMEGGVCSNCVPPATLATCN